MGSRGTCLLGIEIIIQTPRTYPYNGLRVELGGDPNNESDTELSAPSYNSQ